MSASTCPLCRSAGQAVTGIVQAGTWSGESTGAVFGGGSAGASYGVAVGALHGTTHLAQQLAPPEPPALGTPGDQVTAYVLGGLAVFLAFLGLSLYNAGRTGAEIGLLCILLLLVTAAAAVQFRQAAARSGVAAREYDAAFAIWQRRRAAWDRLFYCARCDSVWDPLTGRSSPARAMQNLL